MGGGGLLKEQEEGNNLPFAVCSSYKSAQLTFQWNNVHTYNKDEDDDDNDDDDNDDDDNDDDDDDDDDD